MQQTCPGKSKRSLLKRAEEASFSTNPLKEAFAVFGKDKQGNSLASQALDSAQETTRNIFPKGSENAYVTGLKGTWTPPQKITVGSGDNLQTFESGKPLQWTIRWDYDTGLKNGKPTGQAAKGPHVNVAIGKQPQSKFAVQLDPQEMAQYNNGNPPDPNEIGPETPSNAARQRAMRQVSNQLNQQVGWDEGANRGKADDSIKWPGGSPEDTLNTLKNYFKQVASGPC